jgi:hypothetical protein
MASAARSLLGRPSLRHLKLEAKRRLSAGEFTALYEAQGEPGRRDLVLPSGRGRRFKSGYPDPRNRRSQGIR